jgi:hypothetical protein
MKDTDFYKLVEFVNVGGGLVPNNSNAYDLMDQSGKGDIITFREMSNRDLSFHRAYFSLLGYIYDFMPKSFKNQIQKEDFYKFVKHLKGEYKIIFTFKDGSKMIEYDSIAMGKMSQPAFEDYIREQLPWIYSDVLGAYFDGDILDGIIDTIEDEYKKFLSKL